jgi:hypothetical protein
LKEEPLLVKMQRRFEKTVNASHPDWQSPRFQPGQATEDFRLLAWPSKSQASQSAFYLNLRDQCAVFRFACGIKAVIPLITVKELVFHKLHTVNPK